MAVGVLQAATVRSGMTLSALTTYFDSLLADFPIQGKTILDVGGGDGLLSFVLAERGGVVTCLEPMASGSNQEMGSRRALYADTTGAAKNVYFVEERFQDWTTQDKFDVVLFHNSINHLDEEACAKVHYDSRAYRTYLSLFRKVCALSKSGGHLSVSDCARRNLYGDLSLKNPFASAITWGIHQQPGTWASIMCDAGFSDVDLTWNFSSRAPAVARKLLGNAFGAYVTTSHFSLRARYHTA